MEVRRGRVDDRREVELTGLGVQPEAARQWLEQQAFDEEQTDDGAAPAACATGCSFAVWPENWPVLDLFLRLQTQWRTAPQTGRLQGLRYEAAERVMRLLRLRKKRRLFTHLQEMEHAVLEAQGDD